MVKLVLTVNVAGSKPTISKYLPTFQVFSFEQRWIPIYGRYLFFGVPNDKGEYNSTSNHQTTIIYQSESVRYPPEISPSY